MNLFECFCGVAGIDNCYNFFKDFTPAFVAIVVGLFATFFSLRQWLVAREKLHLDVFDKRLKAFNAFMRKTGCDMGNVALTPEQYSEAQLDMASSEFLFPAHVRDEMNAIAAIASAYRGTEARWQSLRDKEYPAEVLERGQLAESMRTSREDYDRRIAALPRLVAGIMRFTHISR